MDISISEVKRQARKDLQYSELTLKFTGKNVNFNLLNTLRRLMFNYVPTYAFVSEMIAIEKNTSIFNNDQLRTRLSQLPIYDASLKIDYLNEKYVTGNYGSANREKHPDEEKIELYISSHNSATDIINVTTNEIKYFINGVQKNDPYNKNYPILLTQLRPNETIKCKMTAALGIGYKNVIWSAISNAYYNDKYEMTIESHGQFDEYEILWKAVMYMQKRMADVKRIINNKFDNKIPMQGIEIILDGSYTISNLLTEYLQEHDDVAYAGRSKINDLLDDVIIIVKYKKEIPPLNPFNNAIDRVIGVMNYIEKVIYVMGKLNINK